MKGWIKLSRKIQKNFLWNDKEPFDKRSAWIDLLLLANHEDHEMIHKGKLIIAKRGEVNMSILQLADRWRWSRGKVNRFLTLLETAKMCNVNSTTDGTTITIENYSVYQDRRTADDTTDVATHDTTHGQQTDTHKNDKNYKNDKNIYIYESEPKRNRHSIPPTLEEVTAYCIQRNNDVSPEQFIDFYESKGWKVGKEKMKDWQASVRTWERRNSKSNNELALAYQSLEREVSS